IPIQVARAGVNVPAPLAELVMKCLAKNRDDRPADGKAIIAELEKWESENYEKEEGRTLSIAAGDAPPRAATAMRSTEKVAVGSASVKKKIGRASCRER